ncbi:MAG: tetratricopeptide repeat protein [Myxococcota bacterium]
MDEEIQWRQSSHRIERYLSAGRFDEAKKEAQRAADAFTFSGPRTALCESVARSKRYREAKPHCEAAIAGEGFDAYAHYILAVIEARQNHLKKAEALLRRAVEETPGFDEAWTLLAQVVTHRGGKKDLITLRERYRLLHGSQPEF